MTLAQAGALAALLLLEEADRYPQSERIVPVQCREGGDFWAVEQTLSGSGRRVLWLDRETSFEFGAH